MTAVPCPPPGRPLPPLPPEATNGDRPVPITAYNHRCGYEGCPTWVPNHHERCVPHRRIPLELLAPVTPCWCTWGFGRGLPHNHRLDMGCALEPMKETT